VADQPYIGPAAQIILRAHLSPTEDEEFYFSSPEKIREVKVKS